MASVNKLSIRGIRAFSPDREETIEFYSPLTMIVGANGCGKTSIIEALKFCCTGSLPPNAKNGHAFINDPGVTDSTEVKASIKLRFKNKRGQDAVVVRSLQVLRKKSKLEYKALEGVIRMKSEAGEMVSLSHKCSELDKHIPELLGVSAAVMESVIFCHQEESSWPLAECAVLKKKFDDIFESTRFAKALEAIAKTKKDYAAKAKDMKCDVVELGGYLSTNTDDLRRRGVCQEKKDQYDEETATILETVARLDDKIARANEVLHRVGQAQGELRDLEWQERTAGIRVSERNAALESIVEGSEEELENSLRGFELASLETQLRGFDANIEASTRSLNSIREQVNVLNNRRGEASSLAAQLEAAKTQHQKSSEALARKKQLPVRTPSWETTKANDFIAALTQKDLDLQNTAKVELATARTECDAAEGRLLQCRDALNKLTFESSAADKESARVHAEKEGVSKEVVLLHRASDDLREAAAAVEAAQSGLASAAGGTGDSRRVQQELTEVSARIKELVVAISEDSGTLQDLRLMREDMERLRLTRKQTETDTLLLTNEVSTLFGRYRGLLEPRHISTSVASEIELDAVLGSIDAAIRSERLSITTEKKELKSLGEYMVQATLLLNQLTERRMALSSKLAKASDERAALSAIVPELNTLYTFFVPEPESLLSEHSNVQEILDRAVETFDTAQQVKHTISSNMTAFDKFEKARLKGNNACPCCKRGMDTQTEAVYLQELGKLLRKKFFDNKAAVESQAESGRIILEKVRGISSWLIEAGDLELEMKDVITQEAQRDQERRKCAEAETKLGSSVKLKEDQLLGLNELFVEMGALRRRWSDLSARFSELQEKQTRHSQTASTLDAGGRTYQEVEDALQAKTHEREKLELRKEQLQGEENKATKKMYTLRAMLADAEKVLSESKGKEERLRAAQLKRTELEAAAVRIAASKAELTAKLSISQNEVRGAERALQQAKENLKSLEESWNMKTQLSRSDMQDFRSLNDSLRAIQQKCDKTDLSVIDKELSAARRDIESKEEQLKSLTEARVEALQRFQNEERTRKLIVDNLELRRAIREQSMLQEKLSVLRARLEPDKRRVEEATREVSRATQERGKLLNEEATIVGRVRELEEQLKELDAKIMSPTYRDIAKRHRRKNIEYETTLMAVADLDTYYNALDSALATYHTLKIKEINKIIRELWQQVYRGDDIDRIEISSDQDFDTSAGTSKRAYNYRVVMTKGNTPLDMRGRCSAGQRVLAAIVIRLALAETFCLTCGMFALDEPTTNLDDANRAGLAHALARIISNRSRQQNFQLVCITHDEAFVRLLSNELSMLTNFSLPEYYFRVSRKAEGGTCRYFSCIERIEWDDM